MREIQVLQVVQVWQELPVYKIGTWFNWSLEWHAVCNFTKSVAGICIKLFLMYIEPQVPS